MQRSSGPPAKALTWVAESVGAGSHVCSVRELGEGHWHANHAITVRDARGREREFVLRRWARPDWKIDDPDFTPEREAAVLELAGPIAVATPAVVAVDSAGEACGLPALLTDRLPGSPPGRPTDVGAFVRQLAEVLVAIHAVDSREAERRLPAYRRYFAPTEIEPPDWSARPEPWRRALELVSDEAPDGDRGFIHRDYHPGNTLWTGGQLTGVVDWTTGSWGPTSVDTAHMRWNLALSFGLDAARAFLDYYCALVGESASDQRYWDLVALLDLLPDLATSELPDRLELDRLQSYLEATMALV